MIRGRTLIIINYHSASMASRAIESARVASTEPLQVIVVDNSGDDVEKTRVASIGADVVIDAPENPGYGEGANRGVAAASGDVVIIANPDVVFGPASIDQLSVALDRPNVVMTGPRFSWDANGEWLLPPAEVPARLRELDRVLAGRSALWRKSWNRRRRDQRIRFWQATEPAEVEALSGAVIALRKTTLTNAGGFDRRFRLYFEEIDLMTRLRRDGGILLHLPAARVHHLYNQSAGRTTSAPSTYVESEYRYLAKWYGEGFARWIFARRRGDHDPPAAMPVDARGLSLPPGRWLLEASPLADFATTAGHFFEGGPVEIPPELMANLRSSQLYLRATDLATERVAYAVRIPKTE